MRQQCKPYLLALSFALGATSNVLAADPVFTTIDYPGSTSTQAWGMTPSGDIVGVYVSADKATHGFLLKEGRFTPVDFPGAAITLCNSISPRGDIAGEYGLTPTGPHHAYVLSSDGAFTSFDYPGATFTAAIGINDRGETVGQYISADTISHGFIKNGNQFTSFDFPGSSFTFASGVNSQGDIIGSFTLAGVSRGLLLNAAGFTTVDFPNAAFTNTVGINPRGDIVGRYRDAAGVSHGYQLSGGKFSTIDFPGASFTGATSIDPAGNILGRYTLGGVNHGFLLSKPAPLPGSYTVTDLGLVGPAPGQPFYISNNGLIAGAAAGPGGTTHAVLWFQGQKLDLGPSKASNSIGFGINDRGQAVGQAESSMVDPNAEDFCGFKSQGLPSTGTTQCAPFLWESGVMKALPTLGGLSGQASQINNRGEVAGLAENTTRDAACPAPQKFQFKPVVWESGKAHELPTFGGDPEGVAIAINENGQAAGGSGNCSTFNPILLLPLEPHHALLWDRGALTDLGTLGGTGAFAGNIALNVNNKGQVVGNSDLPGDTANHGFLWTKETGMKDLGTLDGDILSAGLGINDNTVVTGVSLDAKSNLRAFVWQNGVMTDLNSVIPMDSPLYLLTACSINANGEIIGFAVDKAGDIHGYLAAPGNGDGTGATVALGATRPILSEDSRKQLERRLPFGRLGVNLLRH